jgi:hypothetical protein
MIQEIRTGLEFSALRSLGALLSGFLQALPQKGHKAILMIMNLEWTRFSGSRFRRALGTRSVVVVISTFLTRFQNQNKRKKDKSSSPSLRCRCRCRRCRNRNRNRNRNPKSEIRNPKTHAKSENPKHRRLWQTGDDKSNKETEKGKERENVCIARGGAISSGFSGLQRRSLLPPPEPTQ